jgi:hypothetical protein
MQSDSRSKQAANLVPALSGHLEQITLFRGSQFWYKSGTKGFMMDRAIDYLLRNFFEPALQWTLNHPVVSVVVVGVLIYWAVRGYRML